MIQKIVFFQYLNKGRLGLRSISQTSRKNMNRKVNIYVKKQDGMHKHPKGDANKIQEGGGGIRLQLRCE